ncbi:Smr/MutS family protein [Pukyongiella litopenaei]|uniref:DNA mismatch repair protein MutS n=1 Tax=Pukyongiella litopenaei TaxID=2605946 RepID=A0A2S0MPR8_9RHOB|nr:Smr/MutS family protein [Pukyongiella litopenaei]AVO37836.1 DNA mismatch repair protein MutS [Pukyongiella litopenaei]
MTRRRRLTPEEHDLWRKVARQAEPLAKPARTASPAPPPRKPDPSPEPVTPAPPAIPDGFTLGARAGSQPFSNDLDRELSDRLRVAPLRMDAKTHRRMKRGAMKPEARIDLHGMTLAQAHPALIWFITSSRAAGKRLVLVITGKGKPARHDDDPIPSPRGVLRRQVPHWLTAAPLSQAVQQVRPAHVSHGGDGAFYVYLRKPGR